MARPFCFGILHFVNFNGENFYFQLQKSFSLNYFCALKSHWYILTIKRPYGLGGEWWWLATSNHRTCNKFCLNIFSVFFFAPFLVAKLNYNSKYSSGRLSVSQKRVGFFQQLIIIAGDFFVKILHSNKYRAYD